MQVNRRHAPLLVALAMTAACGGGGADEAGPDERAAATPTSEQPSSTSSGLIPSTTTTAPVDPTVVPDDPAAIDEAYVEAVLREHNRVIGDALRLQLQGADLKEIVDRYNAIYVPEVADLELTATLQMSPEEVARYKNPPGDGSSDVVELSEVTATCIAVQVLQSAQDLVVDPPEPFSAEVVLRLPQGPADSRLNPTPWLSEGLTQSPAGGGPLCAE